MTHWIENASHCPRTDRSAKAVTAIVSALIITIAGIFIAQLPLAAGLWSSNLYAGLAIYQVEVVIMLCRPKTERLPTVSTSMMRPMDGSKPSDYQISDLVCETGAHVLQNLAWRVPTLILGTFVGVAWCGEHVAVRITTLIPSIVGAIAPRSLIRSVAPAVLDHIRGPLFKDQAQVDQRAAYLRSLVELEAPDEFAGKP